MKSAALFAMSVVLWTFAGVAHADSEESAREEQYFAPDVTGRYFYDGGVVPFVYGSLAVVAGRLFVSPASTPRFFPESEGGLKTFGDTVPEVVLGAFGFAGAGFIAAQRSPARWYHLKGYGEAVLTTMAVTEIAKNVVGRHRPTFREGETTDDDFRRSFFSGHSSVTGASVVYLGLYLRGHIFPKAQIAPVLEGAAWTGLAAILVGVPYSRVSDNRHHVSDVLTGVTVGGALAVAFYAYQEGRYEDKREEFYREKRSRLVLLPDVKNRGLTLFTSW